MELGGKWTWIWKWEGNSFSWEVYVDLLLVFLSFSLCVLLFSVLQNVEVFKMIVF
jgi:hypothetical protein